MLPPRSEAASSKGKGKVVVYGKVLSFHKVDCCKNFYCPPFYLPFPLPFIPIGGGGGGGGEEEVTCPKCDIYWLFTPLRYTFTIILIFYHKFPHNPCSCGPLHFLRLLLSLLSGVVYLLVCSSLSHMLVS